LRLTVVPERADVERRAIRVVVVEDKLVDRMPPGWLIVLLGARSRALLYTDRYRLSRARGKDVSSRPQVASTGSEGIAGPQRSARVDRVAERDTR
jgi:hypothetical protein